MFLTYPEKCSSQTQHFGGLVALCQLNVSHHQNITANKVSVLSNSNNHDKIFELFPLSCHEQSLTGLLLKKSLLISNINILWSFRPYYFIYPSADCTEPSACHHFVSSICACLRSSRVSLGIDTLLVCRARG